MVVWWTGVKGGVSCPATVVVFWDIPAMALRVSLPHTQDAMCLDCGFQPTLTPIDSQCGPSHRGQGCTLNGTLFPILSTNKVVHYVGDIVPFGKETATECRIK